MNKRSNMSNTTDTAKRPPVAFAAIDTYVERNMVSPRETKTPGDGERYKWGDGDRFPQYLAELYDEVTTLRSVIDGCVDFACGDDVAFMGSPETPVNKTGMLPLDALQILEHNFFLYGVLCAEVIRDRMGRNVELYPVDPRWIRTNKDNTVFWYSEKWGKAGAIKAETMPAFLPGLEQRWLSLTDDERDRHASSIIYVKRDRTHVYPAPPFAAALKACEIERCIDNYHLNALDNGFTGSALVNFNNGEPDDAQKEEIERTFNEKFSGHSNAGRIVFSWNPSKEQAATIETPKVEDFGDRYNALAKHSRQQIFTAFRANPNLFGIPTESLGFSSEEYEAAFKLFNRTQIRPAQRMVTDVFAKAFGPGALVIKPFSLEGAAETNVN